jgi:hypothetical protein
MDTPKVNGQATSPVAPLLEKLQSDYDEMLVEVARAEDHLGQLRWKLDYVKSLLDSSGTAEKPGGGIYEGMTIAEIGVQILADEGKPLSAMEIARRAMDGGFGADNIERARSHFSAIISKDINSEKPRFWQVDRGSIGLAEWKSKPAPPPQAPKPAATPPPSRRLPPPVEAPFGEEQQFKDDDIPF